MAKILIVDDEERVRTILKLMLATKGHEITEAGDGIEALERLEATAFDLVISDMRMDRLDGQGLLQAIRERNIGCPLVFITAFATLESAVEALRLGAADYLVKPFAEEQVLLAVERALGMGRLLAENVRLRQAIDAEDGADEGVFISKAMRQVRELALKVAPSDTTVLITGESGTGKEVVAKLIHRAGNRRERRFVTLNCAAISPQLVESELFGHEKGAFTSAVNRKAGKFEFADHGTLFLDEIGELSLEAQAKLLRVIQERVFQRVGGNQDISVDIRLVCATNQDLGKLVDQGRFRPDLYYRIAVFPIHVPPLRERLDAIEALAGHFIRHAGGGAPMENTEIFTPAAIQALKRYGWPGNVRELANAMERVMILKGGRLPVHSGDLDFLKEPTGAGTDSDELFRLPARGIRFEEVQRSLVNQALERAGGNQSAAARILGLSRAKFRTLLKLVEDSRKG
jgi:DNA-binding NtrC family response regulator